MFGTRPPSSSATFRSHRGPWIATTLILICILAGGLLYVRQLREDVRRHTAEQLDAVAYLKVRLVANWREERLADAFSAGAHALVARAISRAAAGAPSAREDLLGWCRSLLQHRLYRTVAVFDARGKLLAFAGPPPEGVHDVTAMRETFFSDLHEDAEGIAHADLFIPLFVSAPEGPHKVGVAMMRAEPADHLFPLLGDWATPSHTGQVLLVRTNGDSVQVLFAAGRPGSVPPTAGFASLRADSPAARAVKRERRLTEGLDSGGQSVLAMARRVPGTGWSVVTQMDEDEFYEPLRERVRWVLLFGAALAAVAVSASLLWWRRQLEVFRNSQHEAELERLALERHFSYLSHDTSDILLLADGTLNIVDANDRALTAYGYDREELLGKRLPDILAPKAQAGLDSRLQAIAAGRGLNFETAHIRRDGSEFSVEASCRVIEIEGERYYQGVIRDISDRKAAERALQRSEERLELALEASGLGIWDWDVRRDELYLSPTLLQMLGYRREELQGGDAIRRLFGSGEGAAEHGTWRGLLDGRETRFEGEMRILAGSGDWIRVWSRACIVELDRARRPARVIGAVDVIPEEKA